MKSHPVSAAALMLCLGLTVSGCRASTDPSPGADASTKVPADSGGLAHAVGTWLFQDARGAQTLITGNVGTEGLVAGLSARTRRGSAWGQPTNVTRARLSGVTAVMSSSGYLAVGWMTAQRRVGLRVRTPEGKWLPARRLGDFGWDPAELDVNDRGDVVISGEGRLGMRLGIWAQGRWRSVRLPIEFDDDAVSVGPDGVVHIVGVHNDRGGGGWARLATWDRAQGLSTWTDLPVPLELVKDADVDVADDGAVTIAIGSVDPGWASTHDGEAFWATEYHIFSAAGPGLPLRSVWFKDGVQNLVLSHASAGPPWLTYEALSGRSRAGWATRVSLVAERLGAHRAPAVLSQEHRRRDSSRFEWRTVAGGDSAAVAWRSVTLPSPLGDGAAEYRTTDVHLSAIATEGVAGERVLPRTAAYYGELTMPGLLADGEAMWSTDFSWEPAADQVPWLTDATVRGDIPFA